MCSSDLAVITLSAELEAGTYALGLPVLESRVCSEISSLAVHTHDLPRYRPQHPVVLEVHVDALLEEVGDAVALDGDCHIVRLL